MNILSLFDGISCGQIALNRAGIAYDNYFASEIEESAILVTKHNYPNTIHLGDVTKIYTKDLPNIDLLIGGSPCQSFSSAGKLDGFNGKSGLFWEYMRILKEVKPKYFLLENVKMKKEWKDIISNQLGVNPIEINSSLVSAQNRPRLYWTNIPNVTIPKDRNIKLKDVINNNYEFKPLTKWFFTKWGGKMKIDMLRTINNEKSFCVTTNKSHSKNYYLNEDKTKARMLERDEVEKLQTLPIGYTNIASRTNAHKMIGNGWTVDVIAHIFKSLKL